MPFTADQKIAVTVANWLGIYRGPLSNPFTVLFLYLGLSLLGLQLIGLAVYLGYTAWSIFMVLSRVRWMQTLAPLMRQALLEVPAGLDDQASAVAILSAANPRGLTRQQRAQELQRYLRSFVSERSDDETTDCRDGHSTLCSHRVSSDTLKFWRAVATTRI